MFCSPALTLSLVSPFAAYYAQSHLSESTCARMHVSLLAPYPWFHLLLITMRKVTCRSQRAQETRFPVLTLSLVSPFANYHAQSHLSKPTFTGCMFPSSHLIPCFTFCRVLFHLLLISMRKVTCQSQSAQDACFPALTLSLVSPFAVYYAQSHLSKSTCTGCMFPCSPLIPCFTFC